MTTQVTPLRIPVSPDRAISAVLRVPSSAHACVVFAHGEGPGMTLAFIEDLARALSGRKLATLRYSFSYMEESGKRLVASPVAHTTVRAAVRAASAELPGTPIFAGGNSLGARMTSEAQADGPLHEVRGLIFLGFPLHSAGKPSVERANHLERVQVPMLFCQGSRDLVADLSLMKQCAAYLGDRVHLHVVEGADHLFHVLARSGRSEAAIIEDLAASIERWILRYT